VSAKFPKLTGLSHQQLVDIYKDLEKQIIESAHRRARQNVQEGDDLKPARDRRHAVPLDVVLVERQKKVRAELERRAEQGGLTEFAGKLLAENLRRRGEEAAGNGSSQVEEDFRHSNDYRTIVYRGRQHTLTANQAHVVKLLHEAHEAGTPDLSQSSLLEELGTPNSRLRDTFKRSELWGTLIVPGGRRGTKRLDLSAPPKKPAL
jgi:hypothetical protein